MNHDLGCDCHSCMTLVWAAICKSDNGSFFFTEAELYELAVQLAAQEAPDVA